MTKQEKDYQQMYTALKRITKYMTPAQLRRTSRKQYGLDPDEALEMAYENVLTEARDGLRRVGKPKPDDAGRNISKAT
jgi:hypothetical protein